MWKNPNADLHRICIRRLPSGEVRYHARMMVNGHRVASPYGTLEEAKRDRDIMLARVAEIRRTKREKKLRGEFVRAPEVVYFIQQGQDGPIKIGRCKASVVAKRLGNLQIANPTELTLLGTVPGDFGVELAIQKRFASLRIRGEWFSDAPEIREILTRRPSWLPSAAEEVRRMREELRAMKATRGRSGRQTAEEIPANGDNPSE